MLQDWRREVDDKVNVAAVALMQHVAGLPEEEVQVGDDDISMG